MEHMYYLGLDVMTPVAGNRANTSEKISLTAAASGLAMELQIDIELQSRCVIRRRRKKLTNFSE
jgi:hypothetical protein